ncbi:STAS domain-containing protein [Streptomyces tropicalis]|uniref:STAS domain-containing protein n=1 Tax=Streptomyces tropicalis TaxID=3034234 RepID=A0ABT6AAI8_9ACTN|nr:STAS domain-containing protein [Streptomyces tropicalis]MDF3301473.1 STAS domain-containing protein [Streptomyces tropicalis]
MFEVAVDRSGPFPVLGLRGHLDHESVVQLDEAADAVPGLPGDGQPGFPSGGGTGPRAAGRNGLRAAEGGDGTAAGAPPVVVADCSRLHFCDSSGMSSLVRLYQRLRPSGGVLRIAAAPPAMRRVLSLTGLDGAFAVYPTVDEALIRPVGHDFPENAPFGCARAARGR